MTPPSPTARKALRVLALFELATHCAYPDIHAATRQSLLAIGYIEPADHRERLTAMGWTAVGADHRDRLTAMGWTAVGEIVAGERV